MSTKITFKNCELIPTDGNIELPIYPEEGDKIDVTYEVQVLPNTEEKQWKIT